MRHYLPIALLIGLAILLAAPAHAQEPPNQAGLVIAYGDGQVATACVAFAEESISGIELLERSEISFIAQPSPIGAAVCKIGPRGCDYPAEGCFCERDGPRSIYWAYYRQEDGAWTYAQLGAANIRVADGEVQGWAWGSGDSGGGAAPPLIELDAICAPPAAQPTTAPATSAPATSAPATSAPAAQPTTAPTTAPTPAPRGPADGGPGYISFAAIAALLLLGLVAAARRR